MFSARLSKSKSKSSKQGQRNEDQDSGCQFPMHTYCSEKAYID